jgi:hypothetical protein
MAAEEESDQGYPAQLHEEYVPSLARRSSKSDSQLYHAEAVVE